MGVEEPVDHLAPSSGANDETEVSQYSELVRDGRLFHLQLCAEITNRAFAGAQAGEYPDSARRRKRAHKTGDVLCRRLGEGTADRGVVRRSHVSMLTCTYIDVKPARIFFK